MTAITTDNYCRMHDLFDCDYAHPVGWDVIEPMPVEDLDAPTVNPAELDAAQDAQRDRFAALSRSNGNRYCNPYVVTDEGTHVEIVAQATNFDGVTFYGRTRHGALVLVKITSRTWQSRPRVRFTAGNDHGYGDGRVTFDGVSFGGFGYRDAMRAVGYDQ